MQTTFYGLHGVTLSTDKREPQAEPGTALSRASAQRASVAQLLLVARLKARNRRDLAVDTLERGAHVMWVTCKSWFSSGSPSASPDSDLNTDKDTDAHRDR
ncbi:MAG: hypothetical protein Q8O29_03900 [Polaromonas sp.]|uniref:hypothetical protein n=1 Tax=Polaromonas sp. TaxID=1869339 RepID=UPI002734AB88|nr:hypothetical protein [Polaromonas sp.]MDP2817420.1 hypothetical protein [Polaromonas sp.]